MTTPAPKNERKMPTGAQGSPINLVSIISRIEAAIDSETAAIRSDANYDFKESNNRKSRYLYEFSRATRGLTSDDLKPEHREGLQRLKGKLEVNERTILAHLNAVAEVAGMIRNAIEASDGDGTYSAMTFKQEAVG